MATEVDLFTSTCICTCTNVYSHPNILVNTSEHIIPTYIHMYACTHMDLLLFINDTLL